MSGDALKKIQQVKLSGATELSLSNFGLKGLPEQLLELPSLEVPISRFNQYLSTIAKRAILLLCWFDLCQFE